MSYICFLFRTLTFTSPVNCIFMCCRSVANCFLPVSINSRWVDKRMCLICLSKVGSNPRRDTPCSVHHNWLVKMSFSINQDFRNNMGMCSMCSYSSILVIDVFLSWLRMKFLLQYAYIGLMTSTRLAYVPFSNFSRGACSGFDEFAIILAS